MTSFRSLHHQTLPLVLPNAWDVASALAFVDAGFPAIGTTSFGVAAALGNPDGGRATKAATFALVRALSRLPVHVTADIEDGYSDDPQEVAAYVEGLEIAGINIEDSVSEQLIEPDLHAAKISAIKNADPDVFVNARVDTYWLKQHADIDSTLERAHEYVIAGADGIFIPGATDPAELQRFAAEIAAPVNVLAHPTITRTELGALGIRRISTGSLPYRAAIDAAVTVAAKVRDGARTPAATGYPEMQGRLVRYSATD